MAINFNYFLKESASSMRRNMALTVAAVMVTTFSLVILGLISMTVHYLNGVAGMVKGEVDEIRVFLKDDVTAEELKSLDLFISDMDEVKSAKYISKDEALEEFKEMFADQPEIIRELPGNPLPASYRIQMKDPKYNKTVAERLETRPEVSEDPTTGEKEIQFPEETVNRVLAWTGTIQRIGFAWVIAFCLVAVALVSITIRMAIYSRRKEIGIMKLVGATNWFIRWPFLMEGVIEGILGGIFGIIAVVVLHQWPFTKLEELANSNLITGGYLALLSVFLILIGIFIGAVGSVLALRRYMEV